MAANTKQIKRDVDRKPSPQYYNPVADEYEYLHGENGASRHILYSSDGQPITSSGNKLAVRASEIETLLSDIKSKDFATQTTLAQILAKIIAAPATEAKQEAARLLLDSLNKKDYSTLAKQNEILTKLAALETKLNGTLDIQLSGSKAEVKVITLISTAEIAVGATEILQTTVPTGKKWTILDKAFVMYINPNATSGTISFESRVSSIALARVYASPYNKRIQFAYNAFFDGGTGQYMTGTIVPKDEAAQASLFKGLVLGNNINIDFRFTNNTDIPYPAGSGARTVYLLVLEEVIS